MAITDRISLAAKHALCLTACIVACCGIAADAQAQPGLDKDPLSFDRNIGGLLGRYCYKCHNEEKASGDVDLAKDNNPRLIAANLLVWETACELIEGGEMPPADAKQPSDEERELIVKFLDKTLNALDCDGTRDPGPPTIRRLNRAEYNNSMRYLTALDLRPAESFAADASSYGFDNIAASLTLTPLQVEQYYAAAKTVVDKLLENKTSASPGAYQHVFFPPLNENDLNSPAHQREAAGLIVQRFSTRAFRRPIEQAWLDRLMTVYDRSQEQKLSYDESVGNMMVAILISPRFLMRAEAAKPDMNEPFPIDDYDLASRLSFFLWSGPPDEALLELASKNELNNADILDAQIDRMLADSRSDALIENFFAPWLQFSDLRSKSPDAKVFPGFDEKLREAILAEPRLAIGEIIRKDRPITELIDADYTYVNETLASHYGIDEVNGDAMRRVALSNRRRGGMLTTAALLMAQADPGRTNVPRRGSFLTGTILGVPAPPPPPDVPDLKEPEASDKPMTLRERLEEHRSNPQCASCHAKIDPLGFGLENYDAIGAWRDQEVGKPIDASGALPDGRSFNGPVELKDILLEGKDEFTRTFVSQMLIYALGRGPISSDKCVIDEVVENTKSHEYRFASIVRSIINSYPFRHRRNPEF